MTPFDAYMRKQAGATPPQTESNQVSATDTQGNNVDPTIPKGSPFTVTAKHGTSDGNVRIEDDDAQPVAEARSPGNGDRGGGAMG